MLIKILYLNLILYPLLMTSYISLKRFKAKCVKVIDGDTIIVKRHNQRLTIRLAFIDAPEINQKSLDKVPVGRMIKDYLEKLVLNKEVEVQLVEKDFFKRWIGVVYLKETSVNHLLVKKGLAILYSGSKFLSKTQKFQFLQAYFIARQRGVGIWQTVGIMNPKNFRKKKALKARANL